jgi:hypothetical protein
MRTRGCLRCHKRGRRFDFPARRRDLLRSAKSKIKNFGFLRRYDHNGIASIYLRCRCSCLTVSVSLLNRLEERPAPSPRQARAVYFWCLASWMADSHSPSVPRPRTNRLAASSSSAERGRVASLIKFCSSHDGGGAKRSRVIESKTLSFRERREVKHCATCDPLPSTMGWSSVIFKARYGAAGCAVRSAVISAAA